MQANLFCVEDRATGTVRRTESPDGRDAVPRYFFDIHDSQRFVRDDEGTDVR